MAVSSLVSKTSLLLRKDLIAWIQKFWKLRVGFVAFRLWHWLCFPIVNLNFIDLEDIVHLAGDIFEIVVKLVPVLAWHIGFILNLRLLLFLNDLFGCNDWVLVEQRLSYLWVWILWRDKLCHLVLLALDVEVRESILLLYWRLNFNLTSC